MSKRRALEDYAQNVLRPLLIKAKEQQIQHRQFIEVLLGLEIMIFLFGCTLRDPVRLEFHVIVYGLAWTSAVAIWYKMKWENLEFLTRKKIQDVMDVLKEPGEPLMEPIDFSVPFLEISVFSPMLDKMFKEEPLLEFPLPPV